MQHIHKHKKAFFSTKSMLGNNWNGINIWPTILLIGNNNWNEIDIWPDMFCKNTDHYNEWAKYYEDKTVWNGHHTS